MKNIETNSSGGGAVGDNGFLITDDGLPLASNSALTWLVTYSWVNQQEGDRLNVDNIERPNKKWVFARFFKDEIKAVLDRQPLLGTGLLSDWPQNGGAG